MSDKNWLTDEPAWSGRNNSFGEQLDKQKKQEEANALEREILSFQAKINGTASESLKLGYRQKIEELELKIIGLCNP